MNGKYFICPAYPGMASTVAPAWPVNKGCTFHGFVYYAAFVRGAK